MKMKEYESPEVLQQLYWKEGLSLSEISRRFGVSRPSLTYWMKKFCIELRPKIKFILSKEELEELYLKKKLSTIKIAKLADVSSRETPRRWLKKFKIPVRSQIETATRYQKHPFSGDLSERAYLVGLRMGDVSASKERRQIGVSTTTTHPAQIQMMKNSFYRYSHVHLHQFMGHYGYKEIHVHSSLDKSFEFLLEKPHMIPEWVIGDDKLFLSFLGGFMDSEGCWYIGKTKYDSLILMFQLSSTSKGWLEQIKSKLHELDIESFISTDKKISKSHYGSKPVYDLQVRHKSQVAVLAEKLLSISKHYEKIKKMKLIITSRSSKWSEIRDRVLELKETIKKEVELVRYGKYQECECNFKNLSTSLHPISVL